MRDHPYHRPLILAGMWGIRFRDESREKIRRIRDQMYEEVFDDVENEVDQKLLLKFLWPEFKNDFLAHDSYLCNRFNGSSPFPTRREGRKFVGAPIDSEIRQAE
ncbi:hypothetical protein Anas_14754 [Armadillidium nasatum]|uniref:Uncharacterized protein n=1 Tax=Armadillidium nasatum TaxID=96803 RepID=A0A5N5SR07_9CRUS|nr:hypothetical protein Anas_14754 [Armadillidium nasatum]